MMFPSEICYSLGFEFQLITVAVWYFVQCFVLSISILKGLKGNITYYLLGRCCHLLWYDMGLSHAPFSFALLKSRSKAWPVCQILYNLCKPTEISGIIRDASQNKICHIEAGNLWARYAFVELWWVQGK